MPDYPYLNMTDGVDYVETVDSPSIDSDKIIRKFLVKKGRGQEFLNSFTHGNFYPPDGYFDQYESSMTGGIYENVSVSFKINDSSVNLNVSTTSTAKPVYSCDNIGNEHALEELASFKMKWIYNLYAKTVNGVIQAGYGENPPWWESATDATNADGYQYCWAKEMPVASGEEAWMEIKHRTKPNDVFLYPDLVVYEKRYFTKKSNAETAIDLTGKLKTPGKTYGKETNPKFWLVVSSHVEEDGETGAFVCQTTYQYSPTAWDEEFYQTSES